MNLRNVLNTTLLTLALALGGQTILMSQASAKPFDTLSKSRKDGKRTHKKSSSSSKKKSESKSKSKSATSRRVTRTTTRPSTTHTSRTRTNTRTRTNVRPRTTTTQRRATTSTHRHGSTTRNHRTVRNVRPRTTYTTTRRGATSRRTYYRSGATRHHSSHSHTTVNHYHNGSSSSGGSSSYNARNGSPIDAYVTGGLGISGFASNEITDLPLPGAGYNLAVGAKGKIFGGELGLNGGGYTFDPENATADIAMVGLSGDLKLQPSFGFFEPYIAAGLGGYVMKDAIIDEAARGVGLRVGVGADFRFRDVALRLNYQHGTYGLSDLNGQYDGDLTAHTETLGANLVIYF